jgi:hypothetical protein
MKFLDQQEIAMVTSVVGIPLHLCGLFSSLLRWLDLYVRRRSITQHIFCQLILMDRKLIGQRKRLDLGEYSS